ncbi:DUF4149 domain-containing protein [Thiomicrorhabdus lithotrophica]|uniref:DUF4149 domain-containing protein n=1 Tax=Thiomicrorhabdus lithotrophica TaxID=2949997 RepID=A0ABY8CGB8_9GAMM|nr:DUF4149 domain-containing protein [Thiomicrorhabdus lithotrophica]WEJ63493.1 DUF4149 domain-containing protein [Thiomicrorhabdus lithotrophica]
MTLSKFMRSQLNYHSISLVIYTFLATLLIVLGYIVTPILFATLTSKMAGHVAGVLFNIGGYISVVLMLILFAWHYGLKLEAKSIWHNFLAMMIMIVLLWLISPWMGEIKALYPSGIDKSSVDWPLFASLHGIYQLGYLIVIIMLIVAMLKSTKSVHLSVMK